MRSLSLLLAAGLSVTLSGAGAQSRPGPAYFLRHPASAPRRDLVLLPGGPLPELPMVASSLPTKRAAAALATAAPVAAEQPAASSAAEQGARPYLAGSRGFPGYDPYQYLPEMYRKYTLPPVQPVSLPLQLLQSAVGR